MSRRHAASRDLLPHLDLAPTVFTLATAVCVHDGDPR
jgi:hypothetical protein